MGIQGQVHISQQVQPQFRVDVSTTIAEVSARLDRLPMTWFIYKLTILLGIAWIAEAFDIGIIGSALLPLKNVWNLTPSQSGLLGVAGTIGIVLALIPSGMLVDRFGRKKVLLWGIAWFSIFTLLGAFAQSITMLIILRFIAGLGQGAIFPLPYAYLSEFVPPRVRGTFMGYLNGILTASYLLPPLISSYILVNSPPELGWKYIFVLGVIPLVLVPILLKWLPESPRWLARKGYIQEARELMQQIENEVSKQIKGPLPEYKAIIDNSIPTQEAGWFAAFQGRYLKKTLTVTSAYIGAFILWYIMLTFGPTLFVKEGFNFAKSLQYNALLMFAGGLGSILMGYAADKFGRRPIISTYAILAAIGMFILYINRSVLTIYVAGIIVGLFGLGIFPITKVYIAEQFPTSIRGRGTFTCEAMARFFGGVLVTYYVPFIVAFFDSASQIFLLISIALFILTALPIMVLGKETKGLSIDDAAKQ